MEKDSALDIQLGSQQATHLGAMSPAQHRLLRLLPDLEDALTVFLNKQIKSSPASAIVAFGLLPEAHQLGAVQALEGQLAFVREAIRNGLTGYNEKSLVRMAMGKLNLFADDNALDKIVSTDIIEIFDPSHIQVYRSYSCFGLCNYSIAELVTYPWYELYERPSWVTGRLMELGESVFAGKHSYLELEDKVPAYTLKETLTDEKSAFQVQEKFYMRMISGFTRESYVLSVKSIVPLETDQRSKIAFL